MAQNDDNSTYSTNQLIITHYTTGLKEDDTSRGVENASKWVYRPVSALAHEPREVLELLGILGLFGV